MLSIRNLTIETGEGRQTRRIVDGVSLDIPAGQIIALVGASGSGKSTTCLGALGAVAPGLRRASGALLLDGVPLPPADATRGVVSTIFQNPRSAFNPVLTIGAHFTETLDMAGEPRAMHAARAEDMLAAAGIEDPARVLQLHAFEMSGGMLQRAMIAIALAVRPAFIFADEPTTDLDLVVQRDILNLLSSVAQDDGPGILLVTHDMGVVAAIADEVAVMEAGRIVEQVPVMDAFHRPAHPVTAALVEAHLSLYRDRSAA